MTDGSLVLQGRIDGPEALSELLAVVGLSRQWMEVVLHDDSRARGTILCKSGRVVTAFAAPDGSGIDAFVSACRDHAGAYAVYHRPEPPEVVEPIGTLAELLARLERPAGTGAGDVVLEGSFDTFELRDVLEVMAIGRQVLELEASRADGSRVLLTSKAGRVLACEEPERRRAGLAAFRALLEDPGATFRVRRSASVPATAPLGTFAALLAPVARPRASDTRSQVVLEGSFADTPMADLLEVVALTRQLVDLVLLDDTGTRGTLVVKAGQVLDARSARSGRAGLDAFHELVRDPGRAFRVVRRTEPVGARSPIGNLADLVRRTPPPRDPSISQTGPVREILLEGRFTRTPFTEVLRVLSLSRQHLVLLLRSGGRTRGRIVTKAGRILEAEHTGRRGAAGLSALMADPGESFVVYRVPPGEPLPEPIGRVRDLVPVPDEDAQPTRIEASWAPAPPAVLAPVEPKPLPAAPDPAEALRDRIAELTAAVASLERTVASLPAPEARSGGATVLLQALTLLVAGALLVRILLGG